MPTNGITPARVFSRWAATYQTWMGYGDTEDRWTWTAGPPITITPDSEVICGNQTLRNVACDDRVLAWDTAGGNQSQGFLIFKDNGHPGYYWSGPVVGVCFVGGVLLNHDAGWCAIRGMVPLGAWAATYQTWLRQSGADTNQPWADGPVVRISARGVVELDDQPLHNVTFADNSLAWDTAGGNQSQGRIIFKDHDQPGYHWSEPITGACFTGGLLLSDGAGWYDFQGHAPQQRVQHVA